LVDGVVKKTGSIAETITGVKTFSSSPIVPTPTATTDVTNKDYVDKKPVFKAERGSSQSLTHGVVTIINFDSEEFDSHNRYSTSTYRYTPQRA
jgi:hypothetical protein